MKARQWDDRNSNIGCRFMRSLIQFFLWDQQQIVKYRIKNRKNAQISLLFET